MAPFRNLYFQNSKSLLGRVELWPGECSWCLLHVRCSRGDQQHVKLCAFVGEHHGSRISYVSNVSMKTPSITLQEPYHFYLGYNVVTVSTSYWQACSVFCLCLAHHKLVAVLFVPWYYYSKQISKLGMALELIIRLSPICLYSIGQCKSVTTAAISFFYRRHRLRFLF